VTFLNGKLATSASIIRQPVKNSQKRSEALGFGGNNPDGWLGGDGRHIVKSFEANNSNDSGVLS
jgi:hypothetical protein